MLEFINHVEFSLIKTRRTPYIIYFSKKDDEFSNDVISSLIKLGMSFNGVFSYTLNCPSFPYYINQQEYCDYEHVYSISCGKIYK